MTKSEEILARRARYDQVERVADSLGRMIGVKRLKPSQQLAVEEMAGQLQGTTTIMDPDTGATFEVPRRMPLMFAAAVVEVDDKHYAFAKTRGELNAVLDMLDEEGLAAVAQAFGKLSAKEGEGSASGDVVADAKN